jgi:CBS domain-containing protein
MTYATTRKDSIQHALRELISARDEVRLRMHLLSLEARQRWGELESKLLFFQDQVSDGGERMADAASAKARELTRSIRDFMQHASAEHPDTERGELRMDEPARSIMTEVVRSCSLESSLNDAARLMWENDCGGVPVIDSNAKLCGIITDRDICMATYTRGQPLSEIRVASAMSQQVFSCLPSATLEQVLRIMKERKVRRVPVANEDGRLLGIISLADVARYAHARGEDPLSSSFLVSALAAVSMDPNAELRQRSSVAA